MFEMPEVTDVQGPLDLSILLPAFNEEEAIVAVVTEIRGVMQTWGGDWEILVVNDGSDDRTQQRAEQTGARVIRRLENGGYGAALRAGFHAARGRMVAIMDADGSYDPSQLPFLLSFFPDYDQVNGARTSEQGDLKLLRGPAKWFIRKLTEAVSGKQIPDLNTGFKIVKRDVVLRYLWALPSGFSCSTSMTLAFLCNDHAVKYIPVTYRKRTGTSKFRPARDTFRYFMTAIRVVMYFRPLRVFLPIAAGLFAIAIAKSLYNIVFSDTGLHDSDILISLVGVMVLSVGMLGDLIVAQGRKG